MAYVYKITNNENGKFYVGVASREFDTDQNYMGSGTAIKHAINKYGRDSFAKELIHSCEDFDEALELEELIVDEDFLKRSDVYNLKEGGKGGSVHSPEIRKSMGIHKIGHTPWNKGVPMSDEVKKKVSESKKGTPPWNKGMSTPDDVRQKQSLAVKGRPPIAEETREKLRIHATGETNPFYGKTHSEESKRKMAESLKGNGLGVKQKIVECPHCGKSGGSQTMKRWHFDNCKFKNAK